MAAHSDTRKDKGEGATRGQDEGDAVFRALADPGRRRLLDSLNARNGQTLGELCGQLEMARQSASKHLKILEEANLVSVVWRGREKLHYLNAGPINAISERWIDRFSSGRVRALADLKRALEDPMDTQDRPEFVYTTYIETTPERLWRGLTDPEFNRQYLGMALESDWEVGSTYVWNERGLAIEHPDQVVLESDPYRRLAFTFHTFVPELEEKVGLSAETIATLAAEPRSRVAFELEEQGEMVKLTVVHHGFEPGSKVLEMVERGWPVKLATLKTGLEREEPAPAAA
jgi:DNA-binding transcriptional ArsR family regulator/uncharacterized protein YndB with AHSA1/START domain